MKAMSLRISMQTLSPCLTPSSCKPLAMRRAIAMSPWSRLRSPLIKSFAPPAPNRDRAGGA